MGDTALIRGVASAAKHLRPDICVVGVQAERAPAHHLPWNRGVPVPTPTSDTVADGLATRTPIRENVTAIRALVDEVWLVTEIHMLGATDAHRGFRSNSVAGIGENDSAILCPP